jgi:hypothetical protein
MHPPLVTNETDSYLTLDNNAKVSRLLALSLEQLANEDESDCFEKKASTRYDYDNNRKNTELEHEIAKAIAGLMNGEGGLLAVGIKSDEIECLKAARRFK